MVGKTFIAAALGIAAVNAQSCTLAQGQPLSGNSVFTPDSQNIPVIGQPFQVVYDGTGIAQGQTLRFELWRGPGNNLVEIGPIAEVANCGTSRCAFTWTPASNLVPGVGGTNTGYGLRLVNLANCGYQWTVNFSLLAAAVQSSSAAPSVSSLPSLSALPPRPSGSALIPSGSALPPSPSASGGAPPPPYPSDDCDEPGNGGQTGPGTGGYPYPNNGSYSNGTGGVSPTYRPLQSNDGARMAISAFGAIVAFAAAVMAL